MRTTPAPFVVIASSLVALAAEPALDGTPVKSIWNAASVVREIELVSSPEFTADEALFRGSAQTRRTDAATKEDVTVSLSWTIGRAAGMASEIEGRAPIPPGIDFVVRTEIDRDARHAVGWTAVELTQDGRLFATPLGVRDGEGRFYPSDAAHEFEATLFSSVGLSTVRTTSVVIAPDDVASLLRRQTQELMDAVAPGDAEVWRRYLRDDVVYLDENGVAYDKATLLRELTPLPRGLVGRIEVDTFKATLLGSTAVAVGELQEDLDYHGQSLRTRFRFLDTWLKSDEGWRLAARHVEAVLKDPPAITLRRADLCAYSGVYGLTATITTVIRCDEDGLTSERAGGPRAKLRPEFRDVFFEPGKPRSRRIFIRDSGGAVVAFVDRREGEDVRWKRIGNVPAAGK